MTGSGPVDDELLEKLGTICLRHNEIVRRVKEGSLNPDGVCDDLQLISDGASGDPVERLLLQELRYHWRFFEIAFDLNKFAETLKRYLPGPGKKDCGWNNQVTKWKNLGFEIHFLPKIGIYFDAIPPGLKIMPPDSYFAGIGKGLICRKNIDGTFSSVQNGLEGTTVLIDTRQMPLDFGIRTNSFVSPIKNDVCVGNIVQRLRNDVQIKWLEGVPLSSRFGVSFTEWQKEVRLTLAKTLEVNPSMLRLETILERYVIPHLYPHLLRQSDFKSNAGVWCEEQNPFGDHFFDSVDVLSTQHPNRNMQGIAFRPIVVLD